MRCSRFWKKASKPASGVSFYETRRLQPDAIAQTAQAVADFAQRARDEGALSVRAFATSAARDATNGEELLCSVLSASGLDVEIISGDREADWVFQGITSDPQFATGPLLLLDVGGGSTEFILGEGKQKHFRQSFPLGTVRLMENIPQSDPPTPRELTACRTWLQHFLEAEVRPRLKPAMDREVSLHSTAAKLQLVGTGGTTSILARMEAKLEAYDRAKIEGVRLTASRLQWHVDHLWSLPLEERKRGRRSPLRKAGRMLFLTGSAIFEAIMEHFDFDHLRITTRGLRFGALMEP